MPLDPGLKIVVDQMRGAGSSPLHRMAVEDVRAFFELSPLPAPAVDLAAVENRSVPGPGGPIPVRVYRPQGAGLLAALLYFHGGGWVIGSLDTHDGTCRELASRIGC